MIKTSPYDELTQTLRSVIPDDRLIRDELRLFACSTDASFYRLIPKLIAKVRSEEEVVAVMSACDRLSLPFTFRSAGTSLSGQAVSDSVLIQVDRLWNEVEVCDGGKGIRCGPAVLGGEANRILAPLGRKIGPDPASIDSAMVAGIAANNASGMCCGNVQDTYHTLASARIILADGTILNTGSPQSREEFCRKRAGLVDRVDALAKCVKSDPNLADLIRRKYQIKNTTGYSLHALIDFDDPIDIILHLLVGSEGTLGFFSSLTYNTVPDHPFRATALVICPDIVAACQLSARLTGTEVAAVELMDRQSLRAVERKVTDVIGGIQSLDKDACALLVEVRSESESNLDQDVEKTLAVIGERGVPRRPEFTQEKSRSKQLWEIRKGLFPSLGYARPQGKTIIIEDVAFPLESLADGVIDLRKLLDEYGFDDAVIFGHALQGNLHFVFCVDFRRDDEIRNYSDFLDALVQLVTAKYKGSLKAEHGTGRNMAPFVEAEWGAAAVGIMREIKNAFDPKGLLNPGVILSDDARIHVSNLKQTPPSHPIIEKCTECGFCERTCPSRHLTLTPRQRIAAWREICRLDDDPGEDHHRKALLRDFDYYGDGTCATDGLCAQVCPVGINTGNFIKELRKAEHTKTADVIADLAARNFGPLLKIARVALGAAHGARRALGDEAMFRLTRMLRGIVGRSIPEWNRWVPRPAKYAAGQRSLEREEKVVYFPSCVTRVVGASVGGRYQESQRTCIERLFRAAGYGTVCPKQLSGLCCGMAFSSKGFFRQGESKREELLAALREASENGRLHIVFDTSPCTQRIKEIATETLGLTVYDLPEFILSFVIPRVSLKKAKRTAALHVPCSLKGKTGENALLRLAGMCAEDVFVPNSIPCCGFAGDRGFSHPELTASALVTLERELPSECWAGYSTSRTCEIGVSLHSNVSYQSIAFLVDEVIDRVTG